MIVDGELVEDGMGECALGFDDCAVAVREAKDCVAVGDV